MSMHQYKVNLGVIGNRYGEFERRILELFVTSGDGTADVVELAGGRDIDLWYLLRDGMLIKIPAPSSGGGGVTIMGIEAREAFRLTDKGRLLVGAVRDAHPIE
ncbi:MAG: endonuclease [Aeromicrobium sp.]|nr:endonuclease [Aeromicrobium sp.]